MLGNHANKKQPNSAPPCFPECCNETLSDQTCHTVIYYMMCKISSANIAFGSANIQQYYTAHLSSAHGETTVKRGRINGGKLILSLIYFVV